jgi:hypothetical protein
MEHVHVVFPLAVAGRARRFDWESFGWDIVDKVFRALDYFCHRVSGDTLLDCYSVHAERSLYELADEFAEWSASGISAGDLELLRRMPKHYYDKFDSYVKKRIWEVVEELRREEEELRREL